MCVSFSGCFAKDVIPPSELPQKIASSQQRFHEAKITSFALSIIALLFTAVSLILIAVGTLPSTMGTGLGIIPFFIGAHCGFLSVGLFVASILMGAVAYYRSAKISQLTE